MPTQSFFLYYSLLLSLRQVEEINYLNKRTTETQRTQRGEMRGVLCLFWDIFYLEVPYSLGLLNTSKICRQICLSLSSISSEGEDAPTTLQFSTVESRHASPR